MTWGVSLADQTGFCTWRRNKVFSYLRREWSWDFAGELKKKTGESLILFCCTFWNYTKKGGLMRPCWGSGWRLKLSKWGESIVRSLLLRCLSFALNVQCVRAFFRGNVGVVQRRGYTFTSRPAGVPTVSRWHTQTHTHTCTKALIVCNSVFCPTGLLPPAVSHGGGVPIKFRAGCQDLVKVIERAVSAQVWGGARMVRSQVRYLCLGFLYKIHNIRMQGGAFWSQS